jgi:hypothetical protein
MPAWPQTRDGKLGQLEFLQVLCEDEIARRDTAALARRVRRARFEQPNTFDTTATCGGHATAGGTPSHGGFVSGQTVTDHGSCG